MFCILKNIYIFGETLKQRTMKTIEFTLRCAREAQDILTDRRDLIKEIFWIATNVIEIENEEIAEDIIEFLQDMNLEFRVL